MECISIKQNYSQIFKESMILTRAQNVTLIFTGLIMEENVYVVKLIVQEQIEKTLMCGVLLKEKNSSSTSAVTLLITLQIYKFFAYFLGDCQNLTKPGDTFAS